MSQERKEKNRIGFIVGRYQIDYPGIAATSTANMLVVKILFNSGISTKGSKFTKMDISNFYLVTPLNQPE